MIPDVQTLEAPPVPGRFYRVPCVRRAFYDSRVWWPVVGPLHADAELGIDYDHLHFDVRFLSDPFLRKWVDWPDVERLGVADRPNAAMVRIQANRAVVTREVRVRRCWRTMPSFPTAPPEKKKSPRFRALEEAHRDAKLCKVCPHRGMRAIDMPIVDGVRVCHGHGLGWDVQTGRLVPRHGAA